MQSLHSLLLGLSFSPTSVDLLLISLLPMLFWYERGFDAIWWYFSHNSRVPKSCLISHSCTSWAPESVRQRAKRGRGVQVSEAPSNSVQNWLKGRGTELIEAHFYLILNLTLRSLHAYLHGSWPLKENGEGVGRSESGLRKVSVTSHPSYWFLIFIHIQTLFYCIFSFVRLLKSFVGWGEV